MIEVKWLGRGGQGAFTAAKLLGNAGALYEGKYSLAFPAFGPERRGAPVQAFTKIDDTKITDRSQSEKYDYIVVLDETLFKDEFLTSLKENGKIIINSSKNYNNKTIKSFNATEVALEILGKNITNTAMFGALIGFSKVISLEAASNAVKDVLSDAILEKNIKLLRKSYEICREVI